MVCLHSVQACDATSAASSPCDNSRRHAVHSAGQSPSSMPSAQGPLMHSRKHQLGLQTSPLAPWKCLFPALSSLREERHRFRLLRKVNGPAQHAIKGHAGSTNALNKVDGTRRRKNGQDSIRLFYMHVILSPLHRRCNGIRLLRKPIKGHAGSANAKQGRWHATPIP